MNKPVAHIFVFLEIFAQEGGIQSYIKDVLRAYCANGLPGRTEVFLLRDEPGCDNPFEDFLSFHYLKTLPPWKGRLKLALSVLGCLIKHRPERVFCGHINLAPLIRLLCQPLGIPYTVLTYGKEVWQPLPTPQRQALQAASHIWTISRYSRDRLTQANEIDPQKVEILPCVVDEKKFFPAEKPPELINKYGLAGALVLMTVARLWSGDIYKGVDVTIRALPKILSTFPQVKYLVIGRGDDRPRLEQLAQALGVADRVVFAGFVPTEDLVNHYRVADAYIMPSQEGFGIVYLEALACGIPVLSGDSDGSADPLQDGRLGWRVPHRDPDAVAEAVLEILRGGTGRCDAQWLRQETLEQFSQETLKKKLKQLLITNANFS
ncbi:glycosyltransferase family 4 protein [Gloeothece verrucosa]|uniref:Glycosyl transferase group 1 n=1 Tax=Gloeothece verrucosa (strain PCC 7822) TaxID=497965 RepID=E0UKF4_GLOV7|nr:glycosyltransferase family 4 protein [Gloeothece verrucosa]ADN17035.1 glycosyl transferase group 1 [Gloeothece verrucosa PCC 7822]